MTTAMRITNVLTLFDMALLSLVAGACAPMLTVQPTTDQPSYTLTTGETQTLTIGDVTMHIEVINRSAMQRFPAFFAVDPRWLPGYPDAYPGLFHYYRQDPHGLLWVYLFGTPDGAFMLPVFLVTIENQTGHVLSLRGTQVFLIINHAMNLAPVANVQDLRRVIHAMEVAYDQRPASSWISLRVQYPVGLLPRLVELKTPYLRLFTPQMVILPGQAYTAMLVFPRGVATQATLGFFEVPTKVDPAGVPVQRSIFRFDMTATAGRRGEEEGR